jgi:hypothetical protein
LSKTAAPAGIAKAPTGRQCFGVSPNLAGVSAVAEAPHTGSLAQIE